jgi:hypothetical protein
VSLNVGLRVVAALVLGTPVALAMLVCLDVRLARLHLVGRATMAVRLDVGLGALGVIALTTVAAAMALKLV